MYASYGRSFVLGSDHENTMFVFVFKDEKLIYYDFWRKRFKYYEFLIEDFDTIITLLLQ
jgi:hypothetical protein